MKKLISMTLVLLLALSMFAAPALAAHTPAAVLKSMKHLAEEGGILNCDFTVKDTNIDEIIDEYGHPDRDNYVKSAKGSYATFSGDNFVAGYNNGGTVFELRSYSSRIKNITEHALIEAWGKADHISTSSGQRMVSYVLNNEFNIKFVFDDNGQELNHYNVIWLEGTENDRADDHGRSW